MTSEFHEPLSNGTEVELYDLVEQFTVQQQAGEAVDIDSFLAMHPRHADRFRKLLPALEVLGRVGRSSESLFSPTKDALDSHAGTLGDFRLLGEIGRGGMGVVYEAEQISLSRRVALKVLPFASVLDERALKRFKNEAMAAALLEHPHIVPVYAVGEDRGVHFYAMRLVRGQSLAEMIGRLRASVEPSGRYETCALASGQNSDVGGRHSFSRDPKESRCSPLPIAEEEPNSLVPATTNPTAACAADSTATSSLPPFKTRDYHRAVAELGIQAAEALEHAHQQGIVHRDIKPSNLLVDTTGRLWVADFGLAQVQGGANLTMTGDMLGTLRYMSPEQALGAPAMVDHRTDIYSLGATLYEMLALQPVFGNTDRAALLRNVAEVDPRPLRQVEQKVPADLEAIVLKCLEKAPEDRYAAAVQLAADLSRFLAHQPVIAARATLAQRSSKWVKRHAAAVKLAVAVLSAAVVALAVAIGFIVREQARTKAALAQAQSNHQSAEAQRQLVEKAADEVRKHLYASDMKLAFQAWNSADIGQLLTLLERHRPASGERELRGFEWHYLWKLAHSERNTLSGHTGEVYCATFSPDGRQIASAGQDGLIKLWDATTGRELRTLKGHLGEVGHVCFSPDGKLLASCGDDRAVKLWDPQTGKDLTTLLGHSDAVSEVVFSPDGHLLASGGGDAVIRLWNVATRQEIATLAAHERRIRALSFSPDGQTLASCSSDETIRLWDVESRRVRTTLRGHTGIVCALSFSRDGKWLASSSWDTTIKLWDTASGQEQATLTGHLARVQKINFSPTDERLISAGMDGTVRLWDAVTLEQRQVLKGHDGRVWCATFSPDGKQLASSGADGTIKVWDSDTIQGPGKVDSFLGARSMAFSPNSQTLALGAASDDGSSTSPRTWHVQAGREGAFHDWKSTHPVSAVAVSPNGSTWAAADGSGLLQVLEIASGPPLVSTQAHATPIWSVAFSLDGRLLATASEDGKIRVFDAANLGLQATLAAHGGGVCAVAFASDGRTLATGGGDATVKLWDVGSWRERTLQGHAFTVRALAFSPDGRTLASGSTDRRIKLWDVASETERATLTGHTGPVRSVCISPDGRTLASGSSDRTVRLWNLATAQELAVLEGHSAGVSCVAFSPDGKLLASGGANEEVAGNSEVYLWRTAIDQNLGISHHSGAQPR